MRLDKNLSWFAITSLSTIAYDYVGSVIERAAGCKAFTRAITKEAIASENNTADCGLWIHHMGSSQRVQAGGTAS